MAMLRASRSGALQQLGIRYITYITLHGSAAIPCVAGWNVSIALSSGAVSYGNLMQQVTIEGMSC